MKKLLALIMTVMSIMLFSEQAYAQVNETSIDNNINDYAIGMEESQLLAVNSQSNATLEVLVNVTNTVDYLCDQFNNSWADVFLTFYCHAGGDPYACTAYRVIKATCGINGAVRLVIEGHYDDALRLALKTMVGVVFSLEKTGSKSYALYAPNADRSR